MKYTTTLGIEVGIPTLPMLLVDKIMAAHPNPEPPTYDVPTATGIVEHHAHNETTLETDEDKAAWLDYQKRLAQATADRNRAFMRLIMLRLKAPEPTSDDWIAEQRLMGIAIPDDPIERRLHYIETEVFGGMADYAEITRLVMQATGVSAEALQQAEAAFQRYMGGNGNQPLAAEGGQVVILREIRAGAGGVTEQPDA